jgi:hypothetical protein
MRAIFFHICGAAKPTPSYSHNKSIKISENSSSSLSKTLTSSHQALKTLLSFQVSNG